MGTEEQDAEVGVGAEVQNAESPERWTGAAVRWQYRVIGGSTVVDRYGVEGWRLARQTRRGGGAVDRRCGGGPVRLRAAERRWIDGTVADQRAPCG
jgi:hypothetical protein